MDIHEYVQKQRVQIETHLDNLIPLQNSPFRILIEASRYAVLGGGKRLRPLLTLAVVETLKGNTELALTPACALELIHAYSLIHDDLPCMDDDDYRRGKPTLHRAYTEGEAVLTGDYLLTYAFELLSGPLDLSAEQKVKLIQTLAKHAGAEGMIGGQVMDISNENVNLETLKTIHSYKTGALIKASLLFGGIVAKANDDEMKILAEFGDELGLAFQIMDDILDVTDSEEKHGRKVATDVINEKVTYATLLGVEQARVVCLEHFDKALQAVSQIANSKILIELAYYILDRMVVRV